MNISLWYLTNFHTFWHNRCDFLDEQRYFRDKLKLSRTLDMMSLKKQPIEKGRKCAIHPSRKGLLGCTVYVSKYTASKPVLLCAKQRNMLSITASERASDMDKQGRSHWIKEPQKMSAGGQVYRGSTKVINIAITGCADFNCVDVSTHQFQFPQWAQIEHSKKARWNQIKANNTKDFFQVKFSRYYEPYLHKAINRESR